MLHWNKINQCEGVKTVSAVSRPVHWVHAPKLLSVFENFWCKKKQKLNIKKPKNSKSKIKSIDRSHVVMRSQNHQHQTHSISLSDGSFLLPSNLNWIGYNWNESFSTKLKYATRQKCSFRLKDTVFTYSKRLYLSTVSANIDKGSRCF